jgi:hypothetical protein
LTYLHTLGSVTYLGGDIDIYLGPLMATARTMVETQAVLTCPFCRKSHKVEMPTSYCQVVYVCPSCGQRLTPLPGDCCVFCSYADKKCPPIQETS